MRRIVSLLLILALLCSLFACNSKLISSTPVAGKQDDFVNDMTKGIKQRIAYDKDSSAMNDEEIAEYYCELVAFELNCLGKYADVTFSDARFNALAHQYISACQMQKTATENYRNLELFNALWDGGRTARCGIIIYFYENYGLGLTSEEAASYTNDNSISYSISGDSSGVLDMFNDDDDAKLQEGDLTITQASGKIVSYSWTTDKDFEYLYVVKNNSDFSLNMISVGCAILDKDKNVLGTTSAYAWVTVEPGKTVNCNSSFGIEDYPDAKYLRIDSLSYDGDGDHTSHEVTIPDLEVQKNLVIIG